MADVVKDLEIRALFDPSQAVSGAAAASEAVESIGDAAASAGQKSVAGGEKAAGAFEELRGKSADVDKAIDAVSAAMDRLESKSTAPNTIAKNAALAQLELETLKQKAEAAGISLEQLGPEASGGLAQAQAAIDRTVERAKALNIAILDTKEKAGLGSRTMRELAESMGQVAASTDRVAVATEKSAVEAEQARQAFSEFGQSMQTLVNQGANVEKEVLDVVKALDRLEKAGDSPKALIKNAALAEIELEKLKAKIDAAARSGTTIGAGVATSLKNAEAQITSAVKKSGDLADRFGDLRVKAGLSAETIRGLAGSAGSAQGVFSLMETTMGGVGAKIGLAGLAVIGLSEGLKLGKSMMAELGKAAEATGDDFVQYVEKTTAAANQALEFEAAARAVEKGLISSGRSVEETIQIYRSYVENTQRADKSTASFAKTVDGLKVPKSWRDLKDEAVRLEVVLSQVFQQGGDEIIQWAKLNESKLKEVAERYKDHGDRVPEYIQKTIDALDKHRKAQDLEAEATKRATGAIDAKLAAYLKIADVGKAVGKAVEDIVSTTAKEINAARDAGTAALLSVETKIKALQQENLSLEEYSKRKKQITEEALQKEIEAGEKERESEKKSKESLEALARQHGLTGEQLRLAVQEYANYGAATDAVSKQDVELQRVIKDLVTNMAEQEKTSDKTSTTTEKLGRAISAVAGPAQSTAEASAKVAQAWEDGVAAALKMIPQIGTMTEKLPGLTGVVVDLSGALNGAATNMISLAEATERANRAAAAARATGSGAGGGAPTNRAPGTP